ATVRRPSASSRSSTATVAPSAANSRALARPIPFPAPVIRATLPLRRIRYLRASGCPTRFLDTGCTDGQSVSGTPRASQALPQPVEIGGRPAEGALEAHGDRVFGDDFEVVVAGVAAVDQGLEQRAQGDEALAEHAAVEVAQRHRLVIA